MVEPGRLVWKVDWRRGSREMRVAIDRARREALELLEAEVIRNAPTEGLKRAVKRTAAQVVVEHPGAAVVEFGAKPHWPPPGALVPWMLSVGKDPEDEFKLARAIAGKSPTGKKGGFVARPYFRPAIEVVKRSIPRNFRKIWER